MYSFSSGFKQGIVLHNCGNRGCIYVAVGKMANVPHCDVLAGNQFMQLKPVESARECLALRKGSTSTRPGSPQSNATISSAVVYNFWAITEKC